MFKKVKKVELEELFLLFATKIATIKDFEKYISLLDTKYPKAYSMYLFKIKSYISQKYLYGFRDYAEEILSNNSTILHKLDQFHIKPLISQNLLN